MYPWLWRHLPGGTAGKTAGMITLALALTALLWFAVFPWLTPRLPVDQVMPGGSACHSASHHPATTATGRPC